MVCFGSKLLSQTRLDFAGCDTVTQPVALDVNPAHRICQTYLLNVSQPVVLYGCETLSLTLREERRLRVFENRVWRRVFGPKRDEVTGEWRKLHNDELSDLYSLPNIVRVVKALRY